MLLPGPSMPPISGRCNTRPLSFVAAGFCEAGNWMGICSKRGKREERFAEGAGNRVDVSLG